MYMCEETRDTYEGSWKMLNKTTKGLVFNFKSFLEHVTYIQDSKYRYCTNPESIHVHVHVYIEMCINTCTV